MNKILMSVFCAILASTILTACGSSGGGNTPVTTCTSTQRQFTLTNSTSDTIWVGITAGTISCLADSDCPTGASGSCVGASPPNAGVCGCEGASSNCGTISVCNPTNNYCYWSLPSLTQSQVKLASGGSSTICFPAPVLDIDIQWSGKIFARTGCDSNGQNCKTGECGADSNGICPTYVGGSQPTSLFEFTLSNQSSFTPTPNSDYYDISVENGINVAISGGPVAGTYDAVAGNAYSCTTAGSTSAQGSLSACSWTVSPPADKLIWLRDVSPTSYAGTTCPGGGSPNSLNYCECTADSQCGSGKCGLAMNASSAQYTRVCGAQIGWWTADELCDSSTDSSLSGMMNCAATVDNGDGTTSTYTELLTCTGKQLQSCYTSGAAGYCCGCATSASAPDVASWPTVLNPDYNGGSDHGCYNNNTNWGTVVQPWITFLKTACSTIYTYPYDDATSTFTCIGNESTGSPHYTVTFMNTN